VSCITTQLCLAAGYLVSGSNSYDALQYSPASGWTAIGEPSELANADIDGVSCVSTTQCWLAGSSNALGADNNLYDQHPLFISYDPETGSWGQLAEVDSVPGWATSVACTSQADCWAAGSTRDIVAGTPPQAFTPDAMLFHYSGGQWTTAIVEPSPGNLFSIQCPTAAECWAVGDTTHKVNGQWTSEPLLEQYSGGRWSDVSLPVLAGGGGFDGLTCTSSTDCTAVGGGDSWPADESPAIVGRENAP